MAICVYIGDYDPVCMLQKSARAKFSLIKVCQFACRILIAFTHRPRTGGFDINKKESGL